jgi:hypothetical protein
LFEFATGVVADLLCAIAFLSTMLLDNQAMTLGFILRIEGRQMKKLGSS